MILLYLFKKDRFYWRSPSLFFQTDTVRFYYVKVQLWSNQPLQTEKFMVSNALQGAIISFFSLII